MQMIRNITAIGILVVMSGADSMDLRTLFGCLGTFLGIACATALWDIAEKKDEGGRTHDKRGKQKIS